MPASVGVDVRWMAGGVQVRGEWLGGQPFDGTRTTGGYVDLIVHRPVMGPLTALARAERLDYATVPPYALYTHRYTRRRACQVWQGFAASAGIIHQAGQLTAVAAAPHSTLASRVTAAERTSETRRWSRRRSALPWHRRLEARVLLASALLVAGALGAVLAFTLGLVSRQSRERAVSELEVARTAFYSLLERRTTSSRRRCHARHRAADFPGAPHRLAPGGRSRHGRR